MGARGVYAATSHANAPANPSCPRVHLCAPNPTPLDSTPLFPRAHPWPCTPGVSSRFMAKRPVTAVMSATLAESAVSTRSTLSKGGGWVPQKAVERREEGWQAPTWREGGRRGPAGCRRPYRARGCAALLTPSSDRARAGAPDQVVAVAVQLDVDVVLRAAMWRWQE